MRKFCFQKGRRDPTQRPKNQRKYISSHLGRYRARPGRVRIRRGSSKALLPQGYGQWDVALASGRLNLVTFKFFVAGLSQ